MGNILPKSFSRYLIRPYPYSSGLPICLRSAGHACVASRTVFARRTIDFVHLIWAVRGEGVAEFDDHRDIINEDQVVCYLPGMKYSLGTRESIWEYRWLTLDGVLAALIVKSLRLPISPTVIGVCPVKLFAWFGRKIVRSTPGNDRQLSGQLYSFLADISDRAHKKTAASMPDKATVSLLQALVDSIQDKRIGIRQLADQAEISRATLARRIKSATGVSPKKYINTIRLQRTLVLLKESDLSMADIATQCGFDSANYMAKFIRMNTGKNPTQLRSS